MKKNLLLLKLILIKQKRYCLALLLILILFCTVNSAQAQLYYVMTGGGTPTGNTITAGAAELSASDAFYRMGYDGANNTTLATSVAYSPNKIEIDGNNNRAFIYDALQGSSTPQNNIRVHNLTTGAYIRTLTIGTNALRDMVYDPRTDYLYYTTEGGNGAQLSEGDALCRMHPDGTGKETLVSSLCLNPYGLELDMKTNRLIIFQSNFAQRRLYFVDIATRAVTYRSFATNYGTVWSTDYDENGDYIYYTVSDGSGTATNASDMIRRQKASGTGSDDELVLDNVTDNPVRLRLDLGNNRLFVNNGNFNDMKIISVALPSKAITTVKTWYAGTFETSNSYPSFGDMAVPRQATITTAAATTSSTSATLGGNLVYGYGLSTERGVVYSATNATPTLSDSKASMVTNNSNGAYSAGVTGLNPSTTYYARAYAVNSAGTVYGDIITFKTLSNNANLSSLSISSGTLSPAFAEGTINYTATVAHTVSSLTFTSNTAQDNATVKVNGTAVTSGSASAPLNYGSNTINVVATAQDNVTTKTYTITVTREKAPQTIIFASTASVTYGDADFSTATASSGLTVSYSSSNTAVATIVNGKIHTVGIGTATITASQSGDNTYNAATSVTQTLTIAPKPITVTANALTKIYGDNDPTLSYTYTGTLITGDTFTGELTRATGKTVGTYAISQGTLALNSNYEITYVPANLVITKRPLIIAPLPVIKTYGEVDFANGAPYNLNGTSVASSDGMTGTFSRDNSSQDVGVYNLTIGLKHPVNASTGQDMSANYDISFVSNTFTINKRPITIAPVSKSKIYGDPDPFLNSFAINAGSLAPGDVTADSFPRDAGEDVGVYSISSMGEKKIYRISGFITDLVNNNYDITFVPATLTITKRAATVTATAQTKTYGDADPALTYTSSGITAGDTFTGELTRATGEAVGTYAINQGSLALNSNYDLTFTGNNLTIGTKTVNVTANSKNKTYGDTDPALTYTADALVTGDSFTGDLTRTAGENAGSYPVNLGTLALNSNYTLNYTGADLTINKKNITITADAKSKTYGDADPALTYTTTGLLTGDALTGALGRQPGETAGTYALTQGTLSLNDNYNTTFNGASLTINKATLTYVANPVSRYFSTENPVFTGTITGFLNGETIATATTGTLTFQSAANANSPVGNYDITGGGLNAANYDFVQANSNATALTINYSTDATLAGISIAEGSLNQPFDPNETGYYINLSYETTSINLSATVNSPFASLAVNGSPFISGSTKSISLAVGNNLFDFTVAAQDGSTKQYQVNVFRAYSPNNNLSSINLSNATFTPAFNNNVSNYTATVDNNIASTDITAAVVDTTATVSANGYTITAAQPYNFPLSVGENSVFIRSVAQNGATKEFNIIVTRKESSDATLSSIGNSTVTLNTPFNPGTHNYHTTVLTYAENINFLPISTNQYATVTVNGQPLNKFGGNFMFLSYGNNLLTINVTSQDGSSTINYVVNVIRPRSNDATVINLTIPNGGSLNEVFDPAVYNYTANVSDSTYTGLSLKISRGNIQSSVKVNNQSVTDPENYFMQLHGGLNNFKIDVTSQDTSATKTYNLAVTRAGQAPPAQSPDASLASFNVSGGSSFSRNFNFNYEELEQVNAPNNVASVSFFINRTNSGATVTVNGAAVADPENYGPVNLVVGDNVFNILVTAEDGVATKNYELHINRLPFVDVTLASLKVNKGSLTPAFAPGVTTYNVTTASSDSTITITPVATNLSTTIQVGVDTITTSRPSSTQELFGQGQTRTFNIRVTAADGVTNRIYRLRVTRPMPSAIATLANVTLSSGTLSPAFNAETLNYSANVANSVTKVSVKPVLTDAEASVQVRVNGGAYVPAANNTLSAQLKLNLGINAIDVLVTAADNSTTQTYTINVKRLYSITDATLAELSLSDTTISPAFASSVVSYKAYVDNSTTNTTVKAVATNPDAKVTINGIATDAVTNTVAIPLIIGTNYATVVVKSANNAAIKTYQVKISRAPSAGSGNADVVFSLRNKPKLIEVATGPAKVNYVASVDGASTSITVTATSKDVNAQVEIEGVLTPRGTASAPIALTGDTTVIHILSTAQNGVTKTYSIAVVKSGSNNADVSLALSGNSTLVKGTSSAAQVNLTTSVSTTATSVNLTATSVDVNAKVRIQGILTPRGQATTIPLTGETTMINVVSTAQDGITTRTYSIAVSRRGSNNADLTFTLSGNPKLMTAVSGPAKVNYITSVDPFIPLTVTAKSEDGNAKVTIQGMLTARNQPSAPIVLTGDTTMISIVSTAQDGVTTSTYSVAVLKRGSNNADIALVLSGNLALTKAGSSTDQQVNYTTTASSGTTSVTVTATSKDANANVKIQGVLTPRGQASAPIMLAGDTTRIDVLSTAQDGLTTRLYTIAVIKPAATLRTSDMANTGILNQNLFASTEKEITIYPNPFVSDVNINLKGYNATQAGVTVTSMQGKMLYNRTLPVNDNKVQLNLSDLGQGVYIINITINGELKAYRIFKN